MSILHKIEKVCLEENTKGVAGLSLGKEFMNVCPSVSGVGLRQSCGLDAAIPVGLEGRAFKERGLAQLGLELAWETSLLPFLDLSLFE